MQISDEIKSKLDIVDIIKEYIPNLKPVGVNFTALSPFKREKTPSFVVSPDKQIWHCFSTGKGGDVIKFVMEMDGLSFVEALRVLAPRAGVQLRRENPAETSKRNRLLDIMETAALYYHKVLLESPLAAGARAYLAKRGLAEKTIMDWQIGFSPDSWDDLINVLKKRGYSDAEIFAAGLSVKKESAGWRSNSFYNRFRGRIMFPISDINGHVCAFTARVSPEKEATEPLGKYINSPQTMLYDKSRIIFGLDKAKMEIKNFGAAIVVEGQMDCIAARQAGFKNVVASSGTAFTAEQLKLLQRYAKNIMFSFDMDEAGQLAADRAIREALAAEMNVKVIVLPEGKDPDELIRRHPEEWEKSVKGAKSLQEYYFTKILSRINIAEPEGKSQAEKEIFSVIVNLKNRAESDDWLRKLAEKLQVHERSVHEDFLKFSEKNAKRNFSPAAGAEEIKEEASVKIKTKEEKLSELLLALILKFPLFLNYVIDRLSLDNIFGAGNKSFYRNLIVYYNEISENSSKGGDLAEFGYDSLKNFLERNPEGYVLSNLLDKLSVLGDKDFSALDSGRAKNEIIKLVSSLAGIGREQRCKEIEKLIASEEKSGHHEEAKKLMEELQALKEENFGRAAETE